MVSKIMNIISSQNVNEKILASIFLAEQKNTTVHLLNSSFSLLPNKVELSAKRIVSLTHITPSFKLMQLTKTVMAYLSMSPLSCS